MSDFKLVSKSKSLLTLLAAFSTFGAVSLTSQVQAVTTASNSTTVPVQILGINDFHGNVATTNKAKLPTGAIAKTGTAAVLAGYLNKYQNDFATSNPNGTTFRFEAGDMVGASPAESALIYDQPTVAALHAMNFEVGTLGNHEFDKGLGQLATVWSGQNPIANDTSVATEFYKSYSQSELSANFPLVVSNLVKTGTNQIPNGYQPYTVISHQTADGKTVKIGVVGVITTQTPSIVVAANVAGYSFTDPAQAISESAKALRAQGVNAIVVLGHTASANLNGKDSEVAGETADILKKLQTINPDNSVDLYMAGHSHTYTDGKIGQTRVVQALSFGEAFDHVTADYDTTTNDFVATPAADVVPTDQANPDVTPDAKVASIIDKAKAITDQISSQPIGSYADPTKLLLSGRAATAWIPVANLPKNNLVDSSGNPMGTPSDRTSLGETYLGTFITKGQLQAAQKALPNVKIDFAMTNNGGIRSDLNADPTTGQVTWGQAQAVQPFRNVLNVVTMTGAQIEEALNQQTFDNQIAGGNQLFLQEYGIKYTLTDNPNLAKDPTHPYVVAKMSKLDGSPIDPAAKYNVVINDFLRGGGDGFTAFADPSITRISGFEGIDTEAFVDYIKGIEAAGQKIPSVMEQEKTYMTAQQLADEAKAGQSTSSTTSSSSSSSTTGSTSSTASGSSGNSTNSSNKNTGKSNNNDFLPKAGERAGVLAAVIGSFLLAGAVVFWKKR